MFLLLDYFYTRTYIKSIEKNASTVSNLESLIESLKYQISTLESQQSESEKESQNRLEIVKRESELSKSEFEKLLKSKSDKILALKKDKSNLLSELKLSRQTNENNDNLLNSTLNDVSSALKSEKEKVKLIKANYVNSESLYENKIQVLRRENKSLIVENNLKKTEKKCKKKNSQV